MLSSVKDATIKESILLVNFAVQIFKHSHNAAWRFTWKTRLAIKIIVEFLTSIQVSRIAARQIQCADRRVSRFNSVNIDWKRRLTYFSVKSQQTRL